MQSHLQVKYLELCRSSKPVAAWLWMRGTLGDQLKKTGSKQEAKGNSWSDGRLRFPQITQGLLPEKNQSRIDRNRTVLGNFGSDCVLL